MTANTSKCKHTPVQSVQLRSNIRTGESRFRPIAFGRVVLIFDFRHGDDDQEVIGENIHG